MRKKALARLWRSARRSGQGSRSDRTLHGLHCMDYEIAPEDVKSKRDAAEAFTLLDVREPWEFETSNIDGAKRIPMGDIPSRAHQELDPEDHIVEVFHH